MFIFIDSILLSQLCQSDQIIITMYAQLGLKKIILEFLASKSVSVVRFKILKILTLGQLHCVICKNIELLLSRRLVIPLAKRLIVHSFADTRRANKDYKPSDRTDRLEKGRYKIQEE